MTDDTARNDSAVAVDPFGFDENRDATLCCHDTVVFIPVVVGTAGGREDLAEQDSAADPR